jgi:hypothetical protein
MLRYITIFFFILCLDYTHAKPRDTDFYTFALLSDIHIGDIDANALGRARSAVTKINQLVANVSSITQMESNTFMSIMVSKLSYSNS